VMGLGSPPYLYMTSELDQPGSKGTPASAPQGVNLRGTHRIVCLESARISGTPGIRRQGLGSPSFEEGCGNTCTWACGLFEAQLSKRIVASWGMLDA